MVPPDGRATPFKPPPGGLEIARGQAGGGRAGRGPLTANPSLRPRPDLGASATAQPGWPRGRRVHQWGGGRGQAQHSVPSPALRPPYPLPEPLVQDPSPVPSGTGAGGPSSLATRPGPCAQHLGPWVPRSVQVRGGACPFWPLPRDCQELHWQGVPGSRALTQPTGPRVQRPCLPGPGLERPWGGAPGSCHLLPQP